MCHHQREKKKKAAEEEEAAAAVEQQRAAARQASQRELASKQASRVAELRLDDRAAATEANQADKYRRAFHRRWESRVAAMQLPAVLRAFGVEVEGTKSNDGNTADGGGGGGGGGGSRGSKPTAAQLRKAYRQAVLRFHPDRQGKASVRERVEAEEKFKIISRKMEEW